MATAAGCRFSLGMTFSSEAEKDAFKLRVDSARRILFPYESTSQRPDIVLSIQSTTPSTTQSTHSFLDTAGIYTGDEDKDCQGWVQQHCCRPRPTWQLESFMKKGGIVQIRFVCPHCKVARTWASSRVLAGHYLASQKLIHAFTCAGMLPSQFINFCKFAEIGVVSNKYIHSVYIHRQYQQIVADSAEESMNAAVQRVKANPEYITSGEGHHLNCHLESRCRQPGYHPKRKILTMREAIKAYEDALKRTLIYRFAESFCCVCSFMQALLVISILGPNSSVETPSGWGHLTTSYY
ncbi:hypothetical protein EMCRGX_G019553 [Ephydatia muelleri]